MVYYASRDRPALTASMRASPDIDSAVDGTGLVYQSLGSAHRQFLHAAGTQHGRGQMAKSQLSSTVPQWAVPLFAKSSEGASGIANPAPVQADLQSAGCTQRLNARASTVVARSTPNKGTAPAAELMRAAGGRVDKRKPRQPTRSPTSHGGPGAGGSHKQQEQLGFHTVKMTFIDDYQRNPTAYSRALMDSERPGTLRSSSNNSHLPSRAFSHNANLQSMARRASAPRPRLSAPASPQQVQLPPPVPALRKSKSATIHRLFPTLREPMEVISAAALQIGVRSAPSSSGGSAVQKLGHLTPPKPSPLAIEDICATASYHGLHQRHQSQPTSGAMSALMSAPYVASSGTNSGASTPRSTTSSKTSTDHLGMSNGDIAPDDDLSREILELRPATNSCSVKWTK
ncbi:hypothetical protein H4S03_007391, partial [Coemansia sp. S3946]